MTRCQEQQAGGAAHPMGDHCKYESVPVCGERKPNEHEHNADRPINGGGEAPETLKVN